MWLEVSLWIANSQGRKALAQDKGCILVQKRSACAFVWLDYRGCFHNVAEGGVEGLAVRCVYSTLVRDDEPARIPRCPPLCLRGSRENIRGGHGFARFHGELKVAWLRISAIDIFVVTEPIYRASIEVSRQFDWRWRKFRLGGALFLLERCKASSEQGRACPAEGLRREYILAVVELELGLVLCRSLRTN